MHRGSSPITLKAAGSASVATRRLGRCPSRRLDRPRASRRRPGAARHLVPQGRPSRARAPRRRPARPARLGRGALAGWLALGSLLDAGRAAAGSGRPRSAPRAEDLTPALAAQGSLALLWGHGRLVALPAATVVRPSPLHSPRTPDRRGDAGIRPDLRGGRARRLGADPGFGPDRHARDRLRDTTTAFGPSSGRRAGPGAAVRRGTPRRRARLRRPASGPAPRLPSTTPPPPGCWPAPASSRRRVDTVTVRRGDSLWSIAARPPRADAPTPRSPGRGPGGMPPTARSSVTTPTSSQPGTRSSHPRGRPSSRRDEQRRPRAAPAPRAPPAHAGGEGDQ